MASSHFVRTSNRATPAHPSRSASPPARRRLWPLTPALGLGLAALYTGCSTTPVPADPVTNACSVSAPEINSWFETGSVTLDGVALPANSVTFPDSPNCSFYKWSEQMFVWLNSPAPPTYGGGGGRIFNSPAFYDVSLLDANNQRSFISHAVGGLELRNLALRAAQVGPHGLPVILDRRGTLLEIDRPPQGPTGKPLIMNEQGQPVEIGRIAMSREQLPAFFDTLDQPILNARPLFSKEIPREQLVQKFLVGRIPFFLNFLGQAVSVEQGQADGAILMAQNGSLVYYQTMVNDVYAYFLTGAKHGAILPGTKFPTSQADLNQIVAFAAQHGKTFPDPEALAVEIKTAWVEAAGLPNLSSYITMRAKIPTYDKSNPLLWVPNGEKTALMALAGMHVVGSTAGHSEMIWSTFEHQNNAPNAAYSYNSTTGPKTVNPDFSGVWLFSAANPDVNHLNEAHMQQDFNDPTKIAAVPGFVISPSNTIRGNAWGATAGVSPNPLHPTAASSNSELISVNNAVRNQLASADVRRNYIMTGATWTIGGAPPSGNFGNPGNTAVASGRAVGTSQMANTTMETYQHNVPTTFSAFGNNCFSCHTGNTTSVSHVFPPLKPLF